MTIRLSAVGYLNARPLVYGLEGSSRFAVRFDVPSRCAELLHQNSVDLGLIPSIEYLRGDTEYAIVPGMAIGSRGPVASVALFTRRDPQDVRSVAMDTSSRTSVALAEVLMRLLYRTRPRAVDLPPDLDVMLDRADAALVIGDPALFLPDGACGARKIDIGDVWTRWTGLPFVYAFWAGRPNVLAPPDLERLARARDEGLAHLKDIAAAESASDDRRAVVLQYLRDNVRYEFGADERAGLELFYRYAVEVGAIDRAASLRFF